jgi:hypothetical protein
MRNDTAMTGTCLNLFKTKSFIGTFGELLFCMKSSYVLYLKNGPEKHKNFIDC